MFPVYGGKCLSCKAVHNWVIDVSLMAKRLKRSYAKDSYSAGFHALVQQWDKCINAGEGYVEK
jgi:hypothetical protein